MTNLLFIAILDFYDGRVAQLGERCPYKAEVTGSIPVPPTIILIK